MNKNGEKNSFLVRLVLLLVSRCSKCLFLRGPFCYGAFKHDPIYIVCNFVCLNISSIYVCIKIRKGHTASWNFTNDGLYRAVNDSYLAVMDVRRSFWKLRLVKQCVELEPHVVETLLIATDKD